jgi:hypothetical protein
MKYFVISYGGVGTHMLMPMIDDSDWLGDIIKRDSPEFMKYPHHLRVPPKSFKELGYDGDVTVIYVFGDPINSILSHFRRNNDIKSDWAYHHCVNVQGNVGEFNTDWDISGYIDNGKDLFGLEDHFDNWVNVNPDDIDYKLMLIKYETSYKHEERIMDFLNTNTPLNFVARKSNWENVEDGIKNGMVGIYKPLLDKVSNFDEIKIIK